VREVTVERKENSEEKAEPDLKPLYARSVVNSISGGMVNPFMGAYAVELGASSSDMGWFNSSTNIANNLMQVFWGTMSDRSKRRVPFIVFGGLILSVLWVPMMFVTSAGQLIVLLTIQALLGSMATPAWTALIGDLVPHLRLGKENASINFWASIGGTVATLVSGIFMIYVHGTIQQILFIPLVVATLFGVASSLVMLKIKERSNPSKLDLKRNVTMDVFDILKSARNTPSFVRYCYVEGVFNFFMSIAWPLFSITQITILNASWLQIAVLSVVQTVVTIVFQGWAGRLADTVGRKPLMVFFRFSLVTVPLAYALFPSVNSLIIVGVFWGFSQALGSASITAYLIDVSPEESRGSFTAVFNLIIGIVTFFGSLVGGYLADYMVSLFGLVAGLQIVYFVSTAGRGIGAALYLKLEETLRR
jgi:DHA1 family multidrug resistance protein-like MFS transporter